MPLPSPHLDRVTLCAIDCVHADLSIKSLRRSMAQCTFARVLLITDAAQLQHIREPLEGIVIERIEPMASVATYSEFMLKRLVAFIETDFVLVVQWDGFVLDGQRWEEGFLDFDYIGARWPWLPLGLDIGNGGFSLRSARLLRALADPRVVATSERAEDQIIGQDARAWLERDYGLVFAPAPLADRFSNEHAKPCYEPPPKTFGFHGSFNLWWHLDDHDLAQSLPHIHPIAPYVHVALRRLGDLFGHNTSLFEAVYRHLRESISVQQLAQAWLERHGDTAVSRTKWATLCDAGEPSLSTQIC